MKLHCAKQSSNVYNNITKTHKTKLYQNTTKQITNNKLIETSV